MGVVQPSPGGQAGVAGPAPTCEAGPLMGSERRVVSLGWGVASKMSPPPHASSLLVGEDLAIEVILVPQVPFCVRFSVFIDFGGSEQAQSPCLGHKPDPNRNVGMGCSCLGYPSPDLSEDLERTPLAEGKENPM